MEISRSAAESWVLSYIVTGEIADIRLPAIMDAKRSDNLWQHTCFEAFVRASAASAYYEFNFAPSTHWAAYRFSGYRNGMTMPDEISAPAIKVQSQADCFTLQTSLELAGLSGLSDKLPWYLGLSAVIEGADGSKSYWALAHPPGKPDFHHADCFTIELSADERR